MTMTRKMRPMIVLKLPPINGQLDVADVVVDDDEREGAEPGALDPGEAADHRDHEQLDRGGEADVARRDLPLPPDEQDPRDGSDEGAKPKASARCSGTLKPSELIRTGSSRTPCNESPKGVRTRYLITPYMTSEAPNAM